MSPEVVGLSSNPTTTSFSCKALCHGRMVGGGAWGWERSGDRAV